MHLLEHFLTLCCEWLTPWSCLTAPPERPGMLLKKSGARSNVFHSVSLKAEVASGHSKYDRTFAS